MSDDPFSSALVSALLGAPDADSVAPNAQMRYGTVTQVSPLLVKVGAATTAMPCTAAGDYFPVLNDYVLVLVQGADRIVVASALATSTTRHGSGAGAPAGTGSNGDEYWDLTNKVLYRSDGGGWIVMAEPPQSYTPTVTNITVGTAGVLSGTFHRSDGYCDFSVLVQLGTSGFAMGTAPTITLPRATAGIIRYQFGVQLTQSGVNSYRAMHDQVAAAGNVLPIYATNGAAGTGLEAGQNITSTFPWTWTTNSRIQVAGRFQMNTRYL